MVYDDIGEEAAETMERANDVTREELEKECWDVHQSLTDCDDSEEDNELIEGRANLRKIELKKKNHVDNERKKLTQAVEKLTLNRSEAVDHAESLADTSKILNKVRNDLQKYFIIF